MSEKKSLILLAALGFALNSTTAYAGATGCTDSHSWISIPNLQPRFEFNIAALALKPGASNLNYVIFNKELPAQSPAWTEIELKPGYSAAFGLGASYIFSGGKDITLDWTHLTSNTSASIEAPSSAYFLGPDFEIGPDATDIRNASGKVQFKYDVVNLSAEQLVNFGCRTQMRFFGGLSNAYLREQVTATYSGTVTSGIFAGPFSTTQTVASSFIGLGPRAGIGASYTMNYGFGLLGEAAASALIGSASAKTNYLSAAQELLITFGDASNSQWIKDQNAMQVIPGFDTKLGISYQHLFNPCMLLAVKAGYQAAVYVNAINQYIPGSLVKGTPNTSLDTGGIFVATMSHTQSNYSVQGPFLQASLQF